MYLLYACTLEYINFNYSICVTAKYFVQGWLVDMINLFGKHGGFEKFRNRILNGPALSVSIIAAMIRWV